MTKVRLRRRVWLCGSSALVGALAASGSVMAQTVPPATGDVAVAPATSTAVAGPSPTSTQTTAAPPTVGEIVVTAQKREQSINQVPLSITAVSGDALTQRGITSTADLAKVVPGFVFAPSPFQEPVYVLRGVGLYDSGLGSSPAVTVYLDQFPLPYPIMTEVAPIDLQRVEALKGPQGTLFGQNSTGGAINYIAAKPTKTLEAGADITGERFGQVQANGYVSGPLTDTLGARLSVGTIQGGAYQYSVTRPNGPDLGNADTGQGRLILDWHPIDKLRFELNANGFYDGSDTQALQLSSVNPGNPARATPALLAAPIVGDDPRAAEFPSGYAFRSHDTFYQVALRTDYEVSPALTLTSLTSYDHVNVNKLVDISGLDAAGEYNNLNTVGRIRTVSQELRGGGAIGPLTYVVGGNYDNSGIVDGEIASLNGTTDQPLPFLPPFHVVEGLQQQTVNDYALFGNVDYRLPANLTFPRRRPGHGVGPARQLLQLRPERGDRRRSDRQPLDGASDSVLRHRHQDHARQPHPAGRRVERLHHPDARARLPAELLPRAPGRAEPVVEGRARLQVAQRRHRLCERQRRLQVGADLAGAGHLHHPARTREAGAAGRLRGRDQDAAAGPPAAVQLGGLLLLLRRPAAAHQVHRPDLRGAAAAGEHPPVPALGSGRRHRGATDPGPDPVGQRHLHRERRHPVLREPERGGRDGGPERLRTPLHAQGAGGRRRPVRGSR